jgi:hypothetical protein
MLAFCAVLVVCVAALVACAGSRGAISDATEPPSVSPAGAESAAEAELSAGWLAEAQRHIAVREYRVSDNGRGLQAPTAPTTSAPYFDASGIRVHDRRALGSRELLRLSWVGLGRGEPLAPVAPGGLSSEAARVEIRRSGGVEWYANSPAGLEQGFTLLERPEGEGALVLELSVELAEVSLQDERGILRAPSGRPIL